MASDNAGSEHDYSALKDLTLEIDGQNDDGTFSLCFWLYLPSSTPFPSTILRQMHSEIACGVPFLVLDEKKKMMLFPLLFLHKETPTSHSSTAWMEIPHAYAKIAFSFDKWVHVGCEVAPDLVRLHINGEIAGEMPLSSSAVNNSNLNGLRSISMAGTDGDDDRFQGFVHSFEVLPKTSSIKAHFVKNPPLQLSVDASSASEIEEDEDGVWSIVGGKASCRRNFSLDVTLRDAFGEPTNREMEVVASLLYADNGTPVENPDDAEAPLLTSYDGIEFACCDRPSKLANGRASFKLKIAQLSSKCDNRLFRIRFEIPKMGSYPFFEAFFSPIRCISRNRNARTSSVMWKRSNSSGLDEGSSELLYNIVREAKLSPSSKRVKLGQENSFAMRKANLTMDRADDECNSRTWTANEDFEILRRIAGCQEFVARENFEKIWCWLYPVAFTLSGDWVNAMWNSASPKWIEGFITKEDAEASLQGPGVLQDPGTFVLRFPTSRSWPHPDAGNLVATYIGSDYNIHHRLLSLDFIFSSGEKEMTSKPLQDMLLAEPELSRLGRIIRSH